MLLLELTHTSHTAAATGIQQVCRQLFAGLQVHTDARAIVHDPFQGCWRTATPMELDRLDTRTERRARRKGEAWSTGEKLRGRLNLLRGQCPPLPGDVRAVLFPEFVMQRCIDRLPELRAQVRAPFMAVFHDCIALKLPQYSAFKTVLRYPHYLHALSQMDAVAAVSESSRQDLLDYWRFCGWTNTPPVEVIPLGVNADCRMLNAETQIQPSAFSLQPSPSILMVGTLEGRKNQLALLDAAAALWDDGLRFELEIVGMAHREMGRPALERIRALQAAGHPLRWLGAVDDATLHERYAACDFTVYPSLLEGFGLPVIESIAHGKPCVCTTMGGLDEVSREGGCLRLDGTDAPAIADGLRRMLTDPALRTRLESEARTRPLRTWADYAADVHQWVEATNAAR